MMTVGDLIKKLEEFDPSLHVGISSDEEGNYIDEWSGDVTYAVFKDWESRGEQFCEYTYTEDEDGYEVETEVTPETATAIVIWP